MAVVVLKARNVFVLTEVAYLVSIPITAECAGYKSI